MTSNGFEYFEEDKLLIQNWIINIINKEYKNSTLKDMILPIFANKDGKKLRPLISLYAFRLLAGEDADTRFFEPLSAAIEISHNASLIVDDVFDKDDLRRGEASFYVKYGTFAALSAAYNLSAFVFDLATRTKNHDVVREVGKIGSALSSALFLSKDLVSKRQISKEFFMNVLYRKTTALFEGAAKCGALLGSNDPDLVDKLRKYGYHFGTAYQLRDDVLGIIGNTNVLGKPALSDITNRFQSLITIEAMKMVDKEDLKRLEEFYLQKIDYDPEIIRSILIDSGAISRVASYALEHRNKAIKKLEEFQNSKSKKLLIELAYKINFTKFREIQIVEYS